VNGMTRGHEAGPTRRRGDAETRGNKFFCKIVKADVHQSVCETGQRAVPAICADCDNARPPEAFCIGCGCSDGHACVSPVTEACFWIKVDREIGIGVCSECPEHIELFEAWQDYGHKIADIRRTA